MTTHQSNPFRPGYGSKWRPMPEPAPKKAPIEVLRDFLATLPEGHHERPGVIRAIEVLEQYAK